jgi:hypothetical protein
MSQTHTAPTPIDFEDLGAATLPWSRSYRLPSKTIGQDFLIEIASPPVAAKPGQRFPVIYVLDGNHAFGLAAMAARALQSGPFPLPPTLVVGIGYHFMRCGARCGFATCPPARTRCWNRSRRAPRPAAAAPAHSSTSSSRT